MTTDDIDARQLAAAPGVEAALDDLSMEFCISSYALDPLLAAIAAHVEAEVARRLAAAPGVEEAIFRHDDATYWRGYRHGGGKVPPDWEDVPRDDFTLRAAIAADRARAVAEATDGAVRAERFADTVCSLVGARDHGRGGQTVDAGTARMYADAVVRIGAIIARDKTRPTPDEARRLVEAFEQVCDMWQYREAAARTTARDALIAALVGKDP